MAFPSLAQALRLLALGALLLVLSSSPCFCEDAEDSNAAQDPHLALARRDPGAAFRLFIARFRGGRPYSSAAEFRRRFRVFQANVARALQRQALDPGAVHGVTPFSDLAPSEFARSALGLRTARALSSFSKDSATRRAPPLPTDDLPTEFNWRDHGAVTPVKNQGMCGSCYAFSAVGAVEGAHFLKTGQLLSLSEQQIVDCDRQCDPEDPRACDAGCNGGLMNNVLAYLEDSGGLQTQADYPYRGRQNKCAFNKSRVAATVQEFVSVSTDEEQIVANLLKHGPLAVAINAGWMQSYVRGVSCPLLCDPRGLDHGVLLVGYGVHGFSPARLKFKDFWIIKNSWGSSWGEKGYYRVCSGRDECGVDTMVTAVLAVDGNGTVPAAGTLTNGASLASAAADPIQGSGTM